VEKTVVVKKLYEDEDFIQDKLQELYRRSQALEDRRRSDLFAAFGLGGAVFLALMAVSKHVSACRSSRSTSCSQRVDSRGIDLSHENLHTEMDESLPFTP
jgi:hypothetical protein